MHRPSPARPHSPRFAPSHRPGRRLATVVALVALVAALLPSSTEAITAGQIDDYQSGTTQSWVEGLSGALPPVPPAVVANAGPEGAGDFALRLTAIGVAVGPGGKLVVNNNQPRWAGSYSAAGVNGIILDVRNPNAFPVTIRVGVDGPTPPAATGGRWITHGVVLPASSGWQTLTFALRPQDLLPGDAGATSAATTLANVAVIRIMHAPTATWQGAVVTGQLELDDVEALPEPSLALGMLAGTFLLRSLASCRRR
ncbi:MAG: hypothetical protein IPK00_22645 [Deltaproteobacteria bacterium]|nr:hypothetical protein [Deltaproteobacteria bacterium]